MPKRSEVNIPSLLGFVLLMIVCVFIMRAGMAGPEIISQ